MLTLTQELFGAADPDLARGDQQLEALVEVINDFFVYFTALTEQRRAHPTDDLASVIANATIDGEPLGPMETISYYVIVATAGHDTTSSAMAGGLLALIEHPEQLARLQADPSLLPTAVDEIIRWVTPVKHFMRNVVEPYELRGHRFEPGDAVLLSYPSANRDEEVFDRPVPLRRRPHAQQAPRVRVRRPLLPRRACSPGWRSGRCSPSCSLASAASSSPASPGSCRRCSSAV